MSDENGRYSCRQRILESKQVRYSKVLEAEKSKAPGVMEEQEALSKHSRKTYDLTEFQAYLKAKKEHDDKTGWFYRQEKRRSRIFCLWRKSEDYFANRGKNCTLHYGGPGRSK